MPNLTTIRNESLTVTINSFGAELFSIKTSDGVEHLWQGNPDVWKDRAPVLFPITGSLRNKKYIYAGKEYTLPSHGFAKRREFTLESKTESSAVFLLKSDAETLAAYPFEFEFRAVYTLDKNALKVDYIADNKSGGAMYLSLGAHEGYSCPGGIENYSIVFDECETLSTRGVNGDTGLLTDELTPVINGEKRLKMRNSYFEIDALVFLDAKSRGLTIVDDRTGERTHVAFPGFDTLLIWTRPGAEYICIEPWSGAPDFESQVTDFEHKIRINKVEKDARFMRTHTITFLGK